jgi:hypothetical protein
MHRANHHLHQLQIFSSDCSDPIRARRIRR